MTRRELLSLAAVPALAQQARKPNIVLILLDDLGYADVGCYGQTKIETPHIDRLAKEGMRFTHAYSGGCVCAPSRCVLMTGKHLGHATIRANAGTSPIRAEDLTIAKILQQGGYATGAFGKWGLGDAGTTGTPDKHGFDQFYGYLHQVHAHSYFPEFLWDNGTKDVLNGKVYSAQRIFEKSIEWLGAQKDKPFFLYACYTVPHGKYETPTLEQYGKKDWPASEKKYAAMVTQGDRYTGTILAKLEEMGVAENTLVIFASDNGGVDGDGHKKAFTEANRAPSGAELRAQKGSLYEGGLRVPFIARWPGRIQPGSTSDTPVYFADVYPTLAELSARRVRNDGLSLTPVFRGERLRPRALYWEHWTYSAKTQELNPDFSTAVRLGKWKAVKPSPDAAVEVYDLSVDEGETTDIASKDPALTAELTEVMIRQHEPPRAHSGVMTWVK